MTQLEINLLSKLCVIDTHISDSFCYSFVKHSRHQCEQTFHVHAVRNLDNRSLCCDSMWAVQDSHITTWCFAATVHTLQLVVNTNHENNWDVYSLLFFIVSVGWNLMLVRSNFGSTNSCIVVLNGMLWIVCSAWSSATNSVDFIVDELAIPVFFILAHFP